MLQARHTIVVEDSIGSHMWYNHRCHLNQCHQF